MPTAPSRRPIRRMLRPLGVPAAALALTVTAVLPAAATPAAPTPQEMPAVTGQACLPGQGVTVVADFTKAADAYDGHLTGPVKLGCAIGASKDIATAGKAAGFMLEAPGGFLATIDGQKPTPPKDAPKGTSAYWGVYVSTTNHLPTGPAAGSWQYSNVGIDGGPAAIDTAVLFHIEQYPTSATRPFALPLDQLPAHQPSGDAKPPASYPASRNGSAVAAATWLGHQLRADGDVLGTAGKPDYGATADAIIGLAASGVGKDVIAAAAQKLYHSGSAYVGAADQGATKWSAVAKMALVLQIAGVDPATFPAGNGTRDLVTELRLAQNADGSFGAKDTDTAFTHALALFALERTAGGVPPAGVSWLQQQQCTTGPNKGSYGFGGCDGGDPDSTALVVQALLGAGVSPTDRSVADADRWLQSVQDKDGALSGFSGPNTNSTGLGGQALLASGTAYHKSAAAAAGYIGSLQVTCQAVRADAFKPADLGAIAFGADDWTAGASDGIGDRDLSTWVRATSQALLGLGLPSIPKVTAAAAIDLPAAETCPAPALTLGTSTVTAGGALTVTVTNLAPSATVTVTLHSAPVKLGTMKSDAAGRASATVTVPATAAAGAHRIVVTGAGVNLSAPLTIKAAPASTSARPSTTGTGTSVGTSTVSSSSERAPALTSSSSGDELAATGVNGSTPYLLAAGTLALLLGFGLLLATRERRIAAGRHRG